jgi:hypothetical protein
MKKGLVQTIVQIFYWVLLAVSVLLIVLFYVKNGDVNPDDSWSKQISDFGPTLNYYLYWSYILVGLALFFTLIFPIANMVSNPKSGLKTLVALVILGGLLFVGYQLGDGTVMDIPGYTGSDNVPERLKLTDMGIYMMYFMFAGAILAMIYSTVSKVFK